MVTLPLRSVAATIALLANQGAFTHNSCGRRFGGSMSSFRDFQPGAALVLALSLSILPTRSGAYTPEEQQACQPDAFRLCSAEIPDVERVTACMIARKSQLSPECRRFFRSDPEPYEARAASPGKPLSIKPAAVHGKKASKTTKPHTR